MYRFISDILLLPEVTAEVALGSPSFTPVVPSAPCFAPFQRSCCFLFFVLSFCENGELLNYSLEVEEMEKFPMSHFSKKTVSPSGARNPPEYYIFL